MAHCRRKLADAVKAGELAAVSPLMEIGRLYAIEKDADERGLNDAQRACLRHARARPILKRLQRHFAERHKSELRRGLLGEAARYAVNQWPELARYAKAGPWPHPHRQQPGRARHPPTKLGMRNWLFIGHPDAGWRSAVIYSIVGSCKLLHVKPEVYLAWVLPQLAAATTKTACGLLPHDFAALTHH